MKKKTIRDIAIIICVFALGGLLMSTSQNVHDYKKERKRLQADISELQEEIHALELEWVYLNRPQRLHDLAIKHTDLRPPQPGQIRESLVFKTSCTGKHPSRHCEEFTTKQSIKASSQSWIASPSVRNDGGSKNHKGEN